MLPRAGFGSLSLQRKKKSLSDQRFVQTFWGFPVVCYVDSFILLGMCSGEQEETSAGILLWPWKGMKTKGVIGRTLSISLCDELPGIAAEQRETPSRNSFSKHEWARTWRSGMLCWQCGFVFQEEFGFKVFLHMHWGHKASVWTSTACGDIPLQSATQKMQWEYWTFILTSLCSNISKGCSAP